MFEAKNLIAKQSTHGVARTRIMVKKALKELQKTPGGTASAEAGSKMVIVNLNSLEHRMVECCCASFFSLKLPAASDKRQFHRDFFCAKVGRSQDRFLPLHFQARARLLDARQFGLKMIANVATLVAGHLEPYRQKSDIQAN